MALPPPDRERSPRTGWGREHWAAVADHLLGSLRPFAGATGSSGGGHAGFALPGPASRYGPGSDALEAFARSFVLAAVRVAGDGGADPHGFLASYREGLLVGTDPARPDRWPRPDELAQARVEAASLALALDLTRPWLWAHLAADERARVLDWFATCVGQDYPPINWVWFRAVVETFLVAEGREVPAEGLRDTLARHETFTRADGWLSDGDERAFDHYGGWALHYYPHLWAAQARRSAPHLLPDPEVEGAWRTRLGRYLEDAVALEGADGSPLLQGRSLVYRMAAAAPLWVAAATGAGDVAPGVLRRAATGQLQHFLAHGCLDEQGLLSLGWHGPFPAMKQDYTGPGSTYWAAAGFYGLLLPTDHPVWTEVEGPLPVEAGDVRRLVRAPGWLVSGTRADGVVRVLNHGTDHALPGDDRTDAPLYARLGYSTATSPPLTGPTTTAPADSAACLLDEGGAPSHRSGMDVEELLDDGVALRGSSSVRAKWVDDADVTSPDHASGRSGRVRRGPRVRTTSLVRGSWEVRVVAVDAAAPDEVRPTAVRVAGWPLAGEEPPARHDAPSGGAHLAAVTAAGLVSSVELVAASGAARADAILSGVHRESGTSPLGRHVAVPHVDAPLPEGDRPAGAALVVALVRLAGQDADGDGGGEADERPAVRVEGRRVEVLWDGGARSPLEVP
ncbi:DUF2264 domain-containing protein [Pseudokineococcus marinus]|uniref:DUF2264 domain-containing protein n=1 Tax=Pseudokineococcus marinus TaxID=351215 RepID=A0A849BQ06_9ACTN|nr:DUF2264 domain-containing protein [Pseudokineococcus marinus]